MGTDGKVFGIAMMKDEEDVAYDVVAHMAGEALDGIIVADNNSTDGTWDELQRVKKDMAASEDWCESHCTIEIVRDAEVGYYQSRKMTNLAGRALSRGATWIVPFDADEIWYAQDRVGNFLRGLHPSDGVVSADLWNHFRTALDGEDDHPFRSMTWRQSKPGALPKVAFRMGATAVVLQGNHAVQGVKGDRVGGLHIRHFPYRSWEHFKRKAINGAAAYAQTDLPETEGAHWRGYGGIIARHGEEALREVYKTYFAFLSPVDAGLVHDPAPFRRWT